MKQKEYNIATKNGVQKIKGEPITVQGRKCVFCLFKGLYRISDLLTGMAIISGMPENTILETKKWNKEELLRRSNDGKHVITDKVIENGKKKLEEYGIKYPVNEI